MDKLRTPFKDRVAGAGIEKLSATCVFSPAFGRLIVGANPVRWKLTRTHASEVGYWHVESGNPSSGLLPVNYRTAFVVSMDEFASQETMREYANRDSTSRAVAIAVGKAVVAAELPAYLFGHDIDQQFAMRIGRRDLLAATGVLLRDQNQFIGTPSQYESTLSTERLRLDYPGAIVL